VHERSVFKHDNRV